MVDTRSHSTTIQKDRILVVDENWPFGWLGQYRVNRIKAGEESDLVHASVFVRNARIAIFCSDNRMIRGIELKENGIADFGQSHVRHKREPSLLNIHQCGLRSSF